MATMRKSGERTTSLHVLVVEDFEPFRRFLRSTLSTRNDVNIVGEAADGLEAVRKATELQPDLVLMDIGLPGLNGIEAARRILALVPGCKIVFVTQESSPEVVETALYLGAHGHVIKARAERDLLLAVDAVREGRVFVSDPVEGRLRPEIVQAAERNLFSVPNAVVAQGPGSVEAHSHCAQFHSDDASLVASLTRFSEKALRDGNVVIVITTEAHHASILDGLRACGMDVRAAIREGLYLDFDVAWMLEKFMVGSQVEPARFFRAVSDIMEEIKISHSKRRVSACGECSPTVWASGHGDTAVQLELLWDEVARTYNLDVLCGYLMTASQIEQDRDTYERICAAHMGVFCN
ncbi:MAG TPA: response regulator [Candidatus Binatia bacterium]|nr:response regulator [Candidatus Binatia bacterium]